jgi:hypothetical protein
MDDLRSDIEVNVIDDYLVFCVQQDVQKKYKAVGEEKSPEQIRFLSQVEIAQSVAMRHGLQLSHKDAEGLVREAEPTQ